MVCTKTAWIALLTTFCLLVAPGMVRCEQTTPWRFGISGGAGVQFHSSDFVSLPPIVLPPASSPFTTARGPVLALGLEVQRLLAPWLYGGLRLDVQAWNGTFTADEQTFFIIDGVGTPGVITHALDMSMTSLGITPAVTVPLGSSLALNTGLQFNYLLGNSYEQSQAVTSPASLPFVYGGLRDIISSGEVDNVQKLSLALTAGVRYSIPISGPLVLEPEISVHYGLTSLMADVNWQRAGVRGAVALVYAPVVQPPVILRDTIYHRDTVQVLADIPQERLTLTSSYRNEVRNERDDVVLITLEIEESYLREIPRPVPLLAVAVDVRFLQKNGEETQSTMVVVEGRMKRHYVPLLPYIFFDEGSAKLPERYTRPIEGPIAGDPMLDVYYRILDTVGARMEEYPKSRLALVGANADEGIEKGNEGLSLRRAEAVKEYLVTRRNILPDRIRVSSRNLPQEPSSVGTEGGREENRRVELSSEDERLLAPVVVSDTDIVADPPLVRFYPDVVSEAGVASWRLSVSLEGSTIREFSGSGSPPTLIEWDIATTPAAERLLTGDPTAMHYEFSATDMESGVARTEPGTMRFQQARGVADGSFINRATDRFSLILFDYNAAAPGAGNRAMVQLVRSVVSPRDSVTVLGYSDATGDEDYNQRLAQRRADAIVPLLKMPRSRVTGMGVDTDLPQYLPEGRFYSRRVDVVREKK